MKSKNIAVTKTVYYMHVYFSCPLLGSTAETGPDQKSTTDGMPEEIMFQEPAQEVLQKESKWGWELT